MSHEIRVLFLADSHLGLDMPIRPRVKRRRRGHDFLANYATALAPALAGEVDLVVHGGDVFDQPNVPVSLAYQALEPLRRIAAAGVPVFVVPGNHERARIPHAHFLAHPDVHVFDRPRTYTIDVRGKRLSLSGFPYERRHVRTNFSDLLGRTSWQAANADVRLLCVHHCVEGATVGPADYVFRNAADVIRIGDVPAEFAAVLSGHIHRHQVLTVDLRKRPVAAPVLYPGSIERTALAEIGEAKGFMMLHIDASSKRLRWEFRELAARPMLVRELYAADLTASEFEAAIKRIISAAPADALLTIRIVGDLREAHLRSIAAAQLRRFAPDTMNLEVVRKYRPLAKAARRASVDQSLRSPRSPLPFFDLF